jgi:hypothetical protein
LPRPTVRSPRDSPAPEHLRSLPPHVWLALRCPGRSWRSAQSRHSRQIDFRARCPSGHDDGEKTRTHERCARIVAQAGAKCQHASDLRTTNRADGGMSACSHVWLRCINMQADGPLTAACLIGWQHLTDPRPPHRAAGSLARPMCCARQMAHSETARFCSPCGGANSCRLAFPRGLCDVSGFLRQRGPAGRAYLPL